MQYANKIGYSDVEPFEVVRVVSEQTMEVRSMSVERDPNWKPEIIPGGFVGHCVNQDEQVWVINSNPEGYVTRIRRKKNGTWQDKWGNKFSLNAKPIRFRDYNF